MDPASIPPLTFTHSHPQQSDAIDSLLSLSFAAEGAAPIPISGSGANALATYSDTTLTPQTPPSVPLASSLGNGTKSHRRLASTGKTRRRLSDAREAANRPLQTTAAALSLASLSLSSSPPSIHPQQISTSLSGASRSFAPAPTSDASLPLTDGSNIPQSISITSNNDASATPIPITNGKGGKKRGVDHKCESCSKIYRHPSCLIKHRWEHTPHWREASKFVLSKHQQVQLLEAAAILSHIAPSASGGTSLPEDRSLWPSFLSGGSLPRADPVEAEAEAPLAVSGSAFPVSSSVPAPSTFSRSNSTGPRLHDYSIPSNVTQVRPGLVSVPTTGSVPQAAQGIAVRGTAPVVVRGTAPVPMPVPASNTYAGYRSSGPSESWSSRHTNGSHYAPSSYGGETNGSSYTHSHSPSEERSSLGRGHGRQSLIQNHAAPPAATGGGWSLPRSSLRSVSVSSQSRSRSNSASEESVDVDVDVLDDYGGGNPYTAGGRYPFNGRNTITRMWKREEDELSVGFSVREEDEEDHMVVSGKERERRMEEEEWDGMEMEMEMD
ncbi:hypothetical protein K443DRAFT_132410 [Laccaria amethystina LaAM-08-1]|uniref:C2H2-type domain-containing protein n=1 Tax=Laccaria amethystina LaAM-08-1 TaxID=1095629 RepID=A0A0C9WRF8_9AGAR|nr:hypothetical protein K443DRAFT_132410 [Laccaria amethystina LaAM-08-1]